jgi:hypothetical protein
MILDKHMYLYRILQHASFMLFNAYNTHILYLEEEDQRASFNSGSSSRL